ncbi:TonB-dependent receptor [Solimonas terrae]|uniref:TonB-dependent receptor n=1 Tax=Solimonas terrae TaxID=1396819 RepID=A0A6M2BSW2_9GAMM|nr:TonB-dependent receptor [Solimonas terrae]NGY05578.1 TonB-dependent receptor [Solimonas terrae]
MKSIVGVLLRVGGAIALLSSSAVAWAGPDPAGSAGDASSAEAMPSADPAAPVGSPTSAAPTAVIAVPGPQTQTAEAPQAAAASAVTPSGSEIPEVIVTANFRAENIQDVSGSTQSFSGADLDKSGAAGMQDYLLQVPSVSLQPSGNGMMKIAMRGVSNINATDLGFNDGSPTVGVYLNDVAIQGSGVFPDLRIFDLDRIEVLKGPQGTLYGEGSMGGAIKMVTVAPDPNNWAFRTDGMYSWTAGGAPNHELRAAVNVPLINDTLGARIVGTTRHEGGFVDYTDLDRPDANVDRSDSLRSILSWSPLDGLDLGYMFLYNYDDRDQFPVVDVGSQKEMTNSQPENQYALTRFTINSLTAKVELPFASLVSVSSFFQTFRDDQRKVPFVQTLIDQEFGMLNLTPPTLFGNSPTRIVTDLHSFSQELRLVSSGEHTVDWIAGAFFRTRKQDFELWEYENSIPDVSALDNLLALTGLEGLNLLSPLQEHGVGSEKFRQIALYGEATWNLIPSVLTITGGLRFYREVFDFADDTQYYGIQALLIGLSPQNIDLSDGSIRTGLDTTLIASGVLPKLSIGWHVTDDQLLYFTVSRGFRSGMANTGAGSDNGPPVVQPDTVWNRELGYKGTWREQGLITNLSLFDIAWDQLQGTLEGNAKFGPVSVPFPYVANAGNARILGAEANVTWAATSFMILSLNGGYNYGVLTDPKDGSNAVPHSLIPNTPRYTGSGTVTVNYPLPDDLALDFSTTYTYTGKQLTTFRVRTTSTLGKVEDSDGLPIDAYGLLKVSLGLSRGTFHAQLFCDNLSNRHAIIGISAPIPQYTIVTPRVVGLRASYDF